MNDAAPAEIFSAASGLREPDAVRPTISVIIAAYNAESYIETAIRSVLQQSYQAVEVIVVDDGSEDNTAEIARRISHNDKRVILLSGEQNAGVSAARNRGLKAATGTWIAILDADDQFHHERLDRLVNFAMCNSLDMAADNLDMRDFRTGLPVGRGFPDAWMNPDAEVSIAEFLKRDMPGMYARELGFIKPLIRTSFLREYGIQYDADYWAGEDFLLYLECLNHGAKLRLYPEPLYIYSLRIGSASSSCDANLELKRANEFLAKTLLTGDPCIRDLLWLRQILIDYELFIWRVKSHNFGKAVVIACRIPLPFLMSKLTAAILRRFGFSPANPSQRALAQVNRRYSSAEIAGQALPAWR